MHGETSAIRERTGACLGGRKRCGETVVLRLGRVPFGVSSDGPDLWENTAWDADRNVFYSRVAVHRASEWHHPQLGGRCPLPRLADRGSRDGGIEHKRQTGHLFDAALPRII